MGTLEVINEIFLGKKNLSEEDRELVKKIQQEFLEREKKSDKSILDEIEPGNPEKVTKFISEFADKTILAEEFIKEYPLHYDKSKIWWFWNKKRKCWEMTDEIDILNLIKYACGSVNVIKPGERSEILNALQQEARKNKPQEAKKTWLQFNDEIIDIETGERFFSSPDYFVTNAIPWDLGKEEETPMIDRIFEEWVGEKYSITLYEIMAYCLLPDYPIHRLFCFIGAGLNGKSCFLRLLERFIGEKNVTTTELETLLNSRFEIARLYKKSVCVLGETNFNLLSRTSIIKKLTGQDTIGYEYKHKLPFEDKNYAKIMIATNNLPVTTDKTLGFYRRWCIIDFPNRFTEKKDILNDIPEEEYKNLALKLTRVLMGLLEKRVFTNEGEIEERAKKYEEKSNPMLKFIDKNYIRDINGHVKFQDFYLKLSDFFKEKGHRILSAPAVSRLLKVEGFETSLRTIQGENSRYILGLSVLINSS